MKLITIWFRNFFIIYLIMINVCLAQTIANKELISLNFIQTDSSVILQTLADYKNINLIIEDHLEDKQTIKLNNVEWHQALTLLAKAMKIEFELNDDLLIVRKQPDPQWIAQQQQYQLKQNELNQPLESINLKVDHAEIKSLFNMIYEQKMLSERGKVLIDERTNTLVVYDIRSNLVTIQQLLGSLDSAVPQIHIMAHIVTMNSESFSELGIKWGYSGSSSQLIDSFDINLGVANPTAALGFNIAKRAGNLLNLELSALEAENQVEIIASPNLLTSHLKTASIKQGTEIPYEVSSGNNGSTSIEFKQAVLGLEVTPRVLANNKIELILYITQNTAGRTIKRSDGGEALAIDTQEIRTQVLVNNGETLVLGGIFQQNLAKDQRSVPGVSRLPLIGGLFKYDGEKIQKRELVIFITPQLVK